MTHYEDTSYTISISPIMLIPSLIISLISIISLWKLFSKVGKPGWHSIVPILNIYDLFEISGMAGWLFIATFVPIVGIIINIMCYINLAHRFGKSDGFGLFTFFFPFVGIPMLAFSNLPYDDTNNYSFHSPIKQNTEDTIVSSKDVMKKLYEDEKHLNEKSSEFQGIPSLNDIYNTPLNGNGGPNGQGNGAYFTNTPPASDVNNANNIANNDNNNANNANTNTTMVDNNFNNNTITMVDSTKSGKGKESKGLFDFLKKK